MRSGSDRRTEVPTIASEKFRHEAGVPSCDDIISPRVPVIDGIDIEDGFEAALVQQKLRPPKMEQ